MPPLGGLAPQPTMVSEPMVSTAKDRVKLVPRAPKLAPASSAAQAPTRASVQATMLAPPQVPTSTSMASVTTQPQVAAGGNGASVPIPHQITASDMPLDMAQAEPGNLTQQPGSHNQQPTNAPIPRYENGFQRPAPNNNWRQNVCNERVLRYLAEHPHMTIDQLLGNELANAPPPPT